MTKEQLYIEISKLPKKPPESLGKRYFEGQEVEYQPYSTMCTNWTFADFWGYSRNDLNDREKLCEIINKKKEEYGMSGVAVSLNYRMLGEATGSEVSYFENGMEYISKHWLTDYSMLEKLEKLDIKNNEFLMKLIEKGKYLHEKFPEMPVSSGCAGPISSAASIRPIELLLRDMRRNPEQLHRLLECCVNKNLEWLQLFCEETGCKDLMLADPVTSMDILGKKYFLEFSKPYFKKVFDGMIEITGVKPLVHICGHTKAIWNDLAEMGVDLFSIDNCEDIVEAKNEIGSKMCLMGNIPPVEIMKYGTIDEIINSVKMQMEKVADSPCGYMISPGCEVPPGTPKENLDAFLYAIKKYGSGARIGHIPKGLM